MLQYKLLTATQAVLIIVKPYSEIWEKITKWMTWHFFKLFLTYSVKWLKQPLDCTEKKYIQIVLSCPVIS